MHEENHQGDAHDHQKELPPWATLTQVSEALGIERNAVRSAARRAIKRQEEWVKKEEGTILIDTLHTTYRSHAKRWKEQKEHAEPGFEDGDDDEWDSLYPPLEGSAFAPYHWYPSLSTEGSRHWPEFCHWLAEQGLQIFFNLLAEESLPQLQWRWGDLQSETCFTDLKEAITDALQRKFDGVPASRALSPLSTPHDWYALAPPPPPTSPYGGEPRRFWPFSTHDPHKRKSRIGKH